MPILNVKVSAKKSPELTRKIAELLLDLTSRILKKKREVTAIAIDYVDHDSWVVGNQPYVSLHFLGADHYANVAAS